VQHEIGLFGEGIGEAGETGAYSASKHGIIGLTKTIALTYAKQGIRVNAICPGGAETPKLTQLASDPDTSRLVDAFVAQTPMQRLAQPEEIADAVIWLCSDHATYVTGHTLVVDGGYLAQ
jgi:NAD(P)-dependent dehydrogenase (short-subunit alcohol dehydrogenase family)